MKAQLLVIADVPEAVLDGKALGSKKHVALATGRSVRTIEHYVSARKIPSIKLGPRCIKFCIPDVIRALSRFTVKEVVFTKQVFRR